MPKLPKAKPVKIKRLNKLKKVRRKRKPRTAANVGTSMVEKEFGVFLESIGVHVDEQFQINYKFFDFIVKDSKILLEFHGSYWHGSPEVYEKEDLNKIQLRSIKNDIFKKALAERYGYKIIYVWEHHFNKDKSKVKKEILEEINKIMDDSISK